MRLVRFDPAALTDQDAAQWWQAWQARSSHARARALDAWAHWLAAGDRTREFSCMFDASVWKDLKKWLLAHVFYTKCAYCESTLEVDRYRGDAEHFRPKARVTIPGGAGTTKTRALAALPDGSRFFHPGYFWLAYDWRNIVPSCADCNSRGGKSDQFPIAGTHGLMTEVPAANEALLPADARTELHECPQGSRWFFFGHRRLDAEEQPLLLNPVNPEPAREPQRHLAFGVLGKVVALDGSSIGEASIRTYCLNRDPLVKRRQIAQKAAVRDYRLTVHQEDSDALERRLRDAMQPLVSGETEYSAAALASVREHVRIERHATDAVLFAIPSAS